MKGVSVPGSAGRRRRGAAAAPERLWLAEARGAVQCLDRAAQSWEAHHV
jgi:hypothetical protein